MKKSPQQLVLRSETLRTVRTLANVDLSRVVGGYDTGDHACFAAVVVPPAVVVTATRG
jgi:hypothetical protein